MRGIWCDSWLLFVLVKWVTWMVDVNENKSGIFSFLGNKLVDMYAHVAIGRWEHSLLIRGMHYTTPERERRTVGNKRDYECMSQTKAQSRRRMRKNDAWLEAFKVWRKPCDVWTQNFAFASGSRGRTHEDNASMKPTSCKEATNKFCSGALFVELTIATIDYIWNGPFGSPISARNPNLVKK